MLWYKGWLETRFRLLFALGCAAFYLTLMYSRGVKTPAGVAPLLAGATFIGVFIPIMLARAGITTQPALQATKGLHGSMYFTLSLPVSRLRLLAVRASLGWLELVGFTGAWCCGVWILFPVLRATTTAAEMLEYAAALVACASGFYSISVLLGTFLDDQWRLYGSGIAIGALWLLFNKTPLPASFDIFRAMSEGSPLLTHTMPWTAIAFSLALSAILFFAALKVVQTREY